MSEVDSEQLQAIVQELQILQSQLSQITNQVNEISLTLEALENQNPNKPVYRAVGNLLLEVDDLEKLRSDLADSKTAFEGHLQRLVDREVGLRGNYEEIIQNLEN
ncbi:MAG: hypothetical protein CXT72_00155 [Methanobacteriota archaeon]|nr:MAG: hypothetical protein CXT72_00155 [Euryarchaeota archaeon]HIE63912.1 hypothetical protein [Candidatus Poseidoniales archaeon]HIK99460.1 hypothetical protein [Candidatus Poseidoniales archaeon]